MPTRPLDVGLWRAKLQPLLSRFNFLAIDHRGISGGATVDSDNSLEATVTVDAPDGEKGTLTIDATLWDPAQPTAALRGQLGHHDVAFTTQTR